MIVVAINGAKLRGMTTQQMRDLFQSAPDPVVLEVSGKGLLTLSRK